MPKGDSESTSSLQAKVLEAAKKARKITDFLHRPYNSSEEMLDHLAQIAAGEDGKNVVSEWHRILRPIQFVGIKELVQHKEDLMNDSDNEAAYDWLERWDESDLAGISDEADHEPWLIRRIRESYKGMFREQWNAQIQSWDPISRIAALAEYGDTESADDWSFDANPLTQWAYQKGNNAAIYGAVKRGKTNFALRLSEYFLKEGWIVVSNIRVANPPKNFNYAPTLSEMLKVICQARLQNKKVLILMDEGAIFYVKIDTVQAQNKALAKIILTLGKLDSNLVYIGHREKDIPDMVIWGARAFFEKTAPRTVLVNITDGIKIKSRLITSVPQTTLDYKPEEVQNFEVDLVVEDLFGFMSKLKPEENQWKAMLSYLLTHAGELKDDANRVRIAAQVMKEKGNSVTEISEALKQPRSTVGSWTRGVEEREET